MLLGDLDSAGDIAEALFADDINWEKTCLGSFYIKPNYPGRSSHVCNGGFLVTDAARNRGVGRLMGEGYLEWAPKLVCLAHHPLVGWNYSCDVFHRAIHILSSTWSTKTMSPHAESGMP